MERILVGLDASPRAAGVLKAAKDLAYRFSAQLILFRAVGIPIEVPHEAYVMSPASLADLLAAEAKKYLDGIAASISPELVQGTFVTLGTPWQSICHSASEHKADLIVIGSHGYSGIDRLIGTTASKVVNHATQSVLVVKSAELA